MLVFLKRMEFLFHLPNKKRVTIQDTWYISRLVSQSTVFPSYRLLVAIYNSIYAAREHCLSVDKADALARSRKARETKRQLDETRYSCNQGNDQIIAACSKG